MAACGGAVGGSGCSCEEDGGAVDGWVVAHNWVVHSVNKGAVVVDVTLRLSLTRVFGSRGKSAWPLVRVEVIDVCGGGGRKVIDWGWKFMVLV